MPLLPWVLEEDFNPGYLARGMHLMPKQGDRPPWQHTQDYWADKDDLPAADARRRHPRLPRPRLPGRPHGSLEQLDDLVIGDLAEVGVDLADGVEPRAGSSPRRPASASVPSRAAASAGATGTASTTRAAPSARATWHAARAVDPVAIPSSTTTTVRPARSILGRTARKVVARCSSSRRSAASTARSCVGA